MIRPFFVLLLTLSLFGCQPSICWYRQEVEKECPELVHEREEETARISVLIHHLAIPLKHDKHLRLEDSHVCFNGTRPHIRLDFISQNIVEIQGARELLVDIVDGLQNELNEGREADWVLQERRKKPQDRRKRATAPHKVHLDEFKEFERLTEQHEKEESNILERQVEPLPKGAEVEEDLFDDDYELDEIASRTSPYWFTTDDFEVYINFESFFGRYVDPTYIGWLCLKDGTACYHAFDTKDPERDKWHRRQECYEQSRAFVLYTRKAEEQYKRDNPPPPSLLRDLKHQDRGTSVYTNY